MTKEEGFYLYDIVLNKKVPQDLLDLMEERLKGGSNVKSIAEELNNKPYSKDHGIEFSPWIVSYLIKQHHLDPSHVALTSLERTILFYATNPDRVSIISNKYFNGMNLGFVENIYNMIAIEPEGDRCGLLDQEESSSMEMEDVEK